MSTVGPQLPPQLDKRKREGHSDSESNNEYGPSVPGRPPKRKSSSPESAPKKTRTIGPTLPPANLDEKPTEAAEDESGSDEDDDDDYGPALPTEADNRTSYANDSQSRSSVSTASAPLAVGKVTRDEWMIVPPSSSDWSSRVDPTKLKNRTFNTSKSARGPSQPNGGDMAKWMETPAEKAARLQREVMGIQDTAAPKGEPRTNDALSEANARRIKEHNDKSRGEALYSEHQRGNPSEQDDDPSARPFDREKDIGGGRQINYTQRKEMMKKAADFGSRFSSGSYL